MAKEIEALELNDTWDIMDVALDVNPLVANGSIM